MLHEILRLAAVELAFVGFVAALAMVVYPGPKWTWRAQLIGHLLAVMIPVLLLSGAVAEARLTGIILWQLSP